MTIAFLSPFAKNNWQKAVKVKLITWYEENSEVLEEYSEQLLITDKLQDARKSHASPRDFYMTCHVCVF